MTYKKIFLVLVVAILVVGIGCSKKTGIKGRLILQTGQTGDVRNCRVRLYIQSDLTGNPVKEVSSDATGVDQTKSEFEFTDVLAGYYYLLAWKDLNNSGEVDNNDIVGVYGGEYSPGYGGSQLQVTEGKMTDVGDIVMYIYEEAELILTTRYVWEPTNGEWVAFYYKFNDDCNVTSWSLTYPDGSNVTDSEQNGVKSADVEYRSPKDPSFWWTGGGNPPIPAPNGNYIITITGTWNGENFTFSDTLNVAK